FGCSICEMAGERTGNRVSDNSSPDQSRSWAMPFGVGRKGSIASAGRSRITAPPRTVKLPLDRVRTCSPNPRNAPVLMRTASTTVAAHGHVGDVSNFVSVRRINGSTDQLPHDLLRRHGVGGSARESETNGNQCNKHDRCSDEGHGKASVRSKLQA